ncbi:MAG: transglycosylase SLT domain-containing protein, partial [Aristaeellaceae bacterium]
MENPQTPIQRRRRADRYQQQEAAPYAPAPSAAPAAPAYQRTPRAARNAAPAAQEPAVSRLAPPPMVTQEDAPPAMARPRRPAPIPEKARKAGHRMPRWITACIIALMFVSLALLAAQNMMQAYLTQRQQEREAAYQAVVDAHPMYYTDLIARYAEEYNLRPAFVTAIILNESSFRTDAESSVGARGLMQLMPDTAEWIAGKL